MWEAVHVLDYMGIEMISGIFFFAGLLSLLVGIASDK